MTNIEQKILNSILAKPKVNFETMPLKTQTEILRQKGYEGNYIYQTYAGKIITIDAESIKVYINKTLTETYDNFLNLIPERS
jgi:hypothetical protein